MPVNARDAQIIVLHKILALGDAGSGKSAQIATLRGKKLVYAFDPGTLTLLATRKVDADVEEFLPDIAGIDMTLKGFNKGAKSDAPKRRVTEPRAYLDWEAKFNAAFDSGELDQYDWIVFDSLTLFVKALMNRMLFLNNRFGDIEELSDYRVVGSKLASIFTAIASMKKNLYVTGHLTTFQDEVTKRVTTQIGIPGAARDMLPKLFSNIWLLSASTDEKTGYTLRTRPEPRGFQAIRTVIPNLPDVVDINIKDWTRPEDFGIGALVAGKLGGAPRSSSAPARPIAPMQVSAPRPTMMATVSPSQPAPAGAPAAAIPSANPSQQQS